MATRSAKLVIEVYSREEAGTILSSPTERENVCLLISIGEPRDQLPAGYRRIRNKLRLLFADTNDDSGPVEDDVKKIIAAGRKLRQRSGRVLIHCAAGISRSSAAAVIIHTVLLGAGREAEAVARVVAQRPVAHPNRRMIELADRLLDRRGELVAAIDNQVSGT